MIIRIKQTLFIFVFIFLLILTGCFPTRHLPEGSYLVNRNSIDISEKKINNEDIQLLIKQKPNKKILGIARFHLSVYNIGSQGKRERKFKNWLKEIGEPPVILDTILTENTVKQIGRYLNNKGYFNSMVSWDLKFRNKKANIFYKAVVANPYTVRNIKYSISNPLIDSLITIKKSFSLIKKGDNYDADIFDAERDRITNFLKEKGFYFFTKDFIRFQVDTGLSNHQLDVNILINDIVNRDISNSDSVKTTLHKQYVVKDIYIYGNYNALESDSLSYDTTIVSNAQGYVFYYLTLGKPDFSPSVFAQTIFIQPGKYYNIADVEKTYKRLADLLNFKYINIQFYEIADSVTLHKVNPFLNAKILLTNMYKQAYSYEGEITNNSNDLGIAANYVYTNRNLFRGAENFQIRAKGAMEVQEFQDASDKSTVAKTFLPFNTFEAGLNAALDIPKFLIPGSKEKIRFAIKPITRFLVGYNYQKRPSYYTRYIASATYGYDWKSNEQTRHIFNPLEINSVKIFQEDSLKVRIDQFQDPKIRYAYSDHLIMAMKYSYIFNNQSRNKIQDFVFFRATAEIAGNTLYAANSLLRSKTDSSGSYQLFNIRYAQYLRIDFDFRYYKYFNEKNVFAFRHSMGIGLPFANMNVLPIEKTFYAGGTNGIRAWPIRSLGPGGFQNINGTNLDRTGDIGIETNFEYRFPLYKLLAGALFVDAGNIWLQSKNDIFPEGEFELNRFYKEIAIGAGIGFRFDFSFFIIRTDFAIPLHDPAKELSQRWTMKGTELNDINFNFGINYPF